MSGLMDVVLACENQLGWSEPDHIPLWKARASGYGRLQASISRATPPPSIPDLHLAIAWCQRRRQVITSPAELVGFVAEAKALAATPENPSTLAVGIDAAFAWERAHADADSEKWMSRLIRACGPVRADVLIEWGLTRGD